MKSKNKLLKLFKGKFLQFKADGIIVGGTLVDEDDTFLYFADDEGVVQVALPKALNCVLLGSETELLDPNEIDDLLNSIGTKKDDMQ
jgi:hypothetical protein